MAEKSASMSALGSFYDALYELAEKQGNKYGGAAVPDLVPGQVSDQLADGVITVAQSMTGATIPGTVYDKQITKPIWGALGTENGFYVNVVNSTVNGKPVGNQLFTIEGDEGMDREGVAFHKIDPGAGVAINPASTTSVLLNPAGAANSMADAYWNNILLARRVDMISDFFGDPIEKVAANMIADGKYGVDKDIATAIAVAHETYEKAHMDGVSRQDLAFGKKIDSNADAAINTAMAMMSGVDDESERTELSSLFGNEAFQKELTDEYNRIAAGTSVQKSVNYNGLFEYYKGGKKLPLANFNDIVDPSLGGNSQGELLQHAFQNVLTKHIGDPATSVSLKRNLTNFYHVVSDQNKFGNMVVGINTAKEQGNIKPLLRNGIIEINSAWGGTNPRRDAAYNRVQESLDRTFDTNAQSLARTASYAFYRWNTMPTLSKIFTPIGLLTGTSWLQMATWTGGPIGATAGKLNVADKLEIRKLETSGFEAKRSKLSDKLKAEALVDPSKTGAKYKRLEAEFNKIDKKFKERTTLVKSQKTTPGTDGWYMNQSRGWKVVDTISYRANPLQKLAYRAYFLSPGAFLGGLFNGDTFQRMAWIGSGYGRNIKFKYTRNADGKGYTKVLDTSGFTRWGRFAHRMLSSEGYQRVASIGRGVGYVMNYPAFMASKFLSKVQDTAYNATIGLAKKLATKAATKLLGKATMAALSAALAYVTAGVSKVLQVAYTILNTISFGGLDKITQSILRMTFQLVVGLTLGIIVLTIAGAQALVGGIGGPQYMSSKLGNGGLYAPDPNFSPVIAELPDDPTKTNPGNAGPRPGSPGTVYNGTCQEIFDKVRAEFPAPASGMTLSIVNNSPRNCGTTVFSTWCDACASGTIRCTDTNIIPLCQNSPGRTGDLFRHELTHKMCGTGGLGGSSVISEFCADVVGNNGGGYTFNTSYSGKAEYATNIATWLEQNKGIPKDGLKAMCFCDASAKSKYLNTVTSIVKGYN